MIKDVDVLIERGEKQLAEAHKIVSEHKNNSRSHLLQTAEREIKELEKVLTQLKATAKNATKRNYIINQLEEDLLHAENRIGEELEYVEDVYKNHNSANKTANELVEFGTKLVTEAKAEIVKHQGSKTNLIRSLEYEVDIINVYVFS